MPPQPPPLGAEFPNESTGWGHGPTPATRYSPPVFSDRAYRLSGCGCPHAEDCPGTE